MSRFAKQLTRYAKKIKDIDNEISSLIVWCDANIYNGKYRNATNIYNKALNLIAVTKSKGKGFLISDILHVLGHSSYSDWQLGYIDTSLSKITRALKIAERSSNMYDLPFVYVLASMMNIYNHSYEFARELSNEGMKIGSKRGVYIYEVYCEIMNIYSNLMLGNKEERFHKNLLSFYETSMKLININPVILQYSVKGLIVFTEYTLAKNLLLFTEKSSTESKLVVSLSPINVLLAETLLKISSRNKKKAEEYYLQSLDISRKEKTKFFELQTAISFSRFLLQQGRDFEAKKMLLRIIKWFDGRNKTDITELEEAKLLLAQLS